MSAKPLTFLFVGNPFGQIGVYRPVARSSSETLYGADWPSGSRTWIGFGNAVQLNGVSPAPGVVQSYALASAASAQMRRGAMALRAQNGADGGCPVPRGGFRGLREPSERAAAK